MMRMFLHIAAFLIPLIAGTDMLCHAAGRSIDSGELRGRALYYTAQSQGGAPMSTFLGRNDMNVSGRGVFCVSCHGDTGRGESETGISAGIITWDALSAPLAAARGSVRVRPAYTSASLKRLLLEGRDPAGKQIDATMPIYALSDRELDDLIAFLKVIGTVPDPGITDASIRIGTMLPLTGVHAATGKVIEATLRAAVDDLNRNGGIYSRKIELVVADAGDAAAAAPGMKRLIENEKVFALVSPYLPGAQDALEDVDMNAAVPVIGPFSAPPTQYPERMRYTFRTMAGIGEQSNALLEYIRLRNKAAATSLIIAGGSDAALQRLSVSAGQYARTRLTEIPVVLLPSDAAGMREIVGKHAKTAQALLYLGAPQTLGILLQTAAGKNWFPDIYIPGQLATREILSAPAAFAGKIFVAYPTLPSDVQASGWSELARNAENAGGKAGTVPQIAALASFKVLVQGLQQSGREVSRERLVRVLEGLNRFDTALIPPVSYSPGRRVGANGAYVVGVDVEKKSLQTGGQWIELP